MARRRVDPLAGGLTPELRRLVGARDGVVEARKVMRAAVAEARDAGATWAAIGAALGMTRQGAWERFADPRHAHLFDEAGRAKRTRTSAHDADL